MTRRTPEELDKIYKQVLESNKKRPSFAERVIHPATNILCLLTFLLFLIQPLIGNFLNTYSLRQRYAHFKEYVSNHINFSSTRGSSGGSVRSSGSINGSGYSNESNGGSVSSGGYNPAKATTVNPIPVKVPERFYTRAEIKLAINYGFDSASRKSVSGCIMTKNQITDLKNKLAAEFLKVIDKKPLVSTVAY